jgi:hypothetical protein
MGAYQIFNMKLGTMLVDFCDPINLSDYVAKK